MTRSSLISVFLMTTGPFGLAQRVASSEKGVEPTPQQALANTNGQANKTVAESLAVGPAIPRGPK